jgi:CRP/FNR family transcriptional regulator, cyclic AMP receptor protein
VTAVPSSALAGSHFLRGMSDDHLARLAEVTSLVTVPAKHRFFTAGTVARQFWLVRAGQVAVDMDVPGQGRIVVETLGRGDLVGVSWFYPPFQWEFGAVAVQPTEAFELDAAAVRQRCEEDPELGYQITRRLITVVAKRLQATRLRMLEYWASPIPPIPRIDQDSPN